MKSKPIRIIKKLDNFWIDLDKEIKFKMLDKGVEAGYLKKEFVEEMKQLELEADEVSHDRSRNS